MSFLAPATPMGRKARQSAIRSAGDVLPSDETMLTNLLSTLERASDASATEGLGWYLTAHSIAAELATDHHTSVIQAAGVLAALSPNTGWAENIRLASEACEHAAAGRTDLIGGHYEDACAKASRILQGAHPTDVLGGRKVRSFYKNILYPLTSGPVTVDRHAVDMLTDRRHIAETKVLERAGTYQRCTAVFRAGARILDLRPHECQAIAWVQWRSEHDIAHKYDPF